MDETLIYIKLKKKRINLAQFLKKGKFNDFQTPILLNVV